MCSAHRPAFQFSKEGHVKSASSAGGRPSRDAVGEYFWGMEDRQADDRTNNGDN